MKKIIIFCLCFISLFVSVSGTKAYFVKKSEIDGHKVEIKQYMMERSENGLKEYTDFNVVVPGVYNDSMLTKEVVLDGYYPSSVTVELWDRVHNSLDRIVSIKNIGTESVYVRTVFAFDKAAGFKKNVFTKLEDENVWTWDYVDDISIDNKEYELYVATYVYQGGELEPNNFTYPSLLEIVMDKNNSLYNGNLKMYVKSQAISKEDLLSLNVTVDASNVAQSTLNAVLGEITIDNHPFK